MSDRSGQGEPRLLALRMHGFKSFAERTNVEFGPGISAVVGPNGSGKSNLADALRWALGEQGRALRSRKSEDVIWAGSEKRAAQGMADVTLVIDNADGLLPVDFQVLELGRRLYRSGENDYLLNKSRIRLRDLVDLLDAAHLADNAFLFIGQGMVDQALALRPEERRPLFEEVAGVRRHERRRRRAEEQLVESESNLARVEDILGELRPQARRLAAQAEQQATRESTAEELAGALLQAMHARWHETAGRLAVAGAGRDRARQAVDVAMEALSTAEAAAAAMAAARGERAALERDRRAAHEAARAAATAAQLRDARLTSDLEALDRDRRRLLDERSAAEAELTAGRRALAAPVPARDLDLEAALGDAERELAHALAELGALRSASRAHGEELAALRRAAAARLAESETARRRLGEVERRAQEEAREAAATAERRIALAGALAAARTTLADAIEGEKAAASAREKARARADASDAEHAGAHERAIGASAAAAEVRARLDGLEARLVEEEARGIARAARRSGGRRVDEDLSIDPPLRAAAEAALGAATRAYVVPGDAIPGLATERGSLVVAERAAGAAAHDDARERRFRDALAAAGGGTLDVAVRRDVSGAARRLLARAAWLPDLRACLAVQAGLPPGWLAVPRDGSAVVTEFAVTLGAGESVLERRSEIDRLAGEAEAADGEVARARAVAVRLAAAAKEAADALAAARTEESRAAGARRAAEEAERFAARQHETVIRESAWHDAQVERLTADLDRARLAAAADGANKPSVDDRDTAATAVDGEALAAWEARATELRARRDRLAEESAGREAARRDAENRRARAEASTVIAEERIARAERDAAALGERERTLAEDRDSLRAEIATTAAAEAAAREALVEVEAADADDRERLAAAERETAAARERLRAADTTLRTADHAELEARLGLDALHEGIVVELAGLGELGIARLERLAAGATSLPSTTDPASVATAIGGVPDVVADEDAVSGDVAALESALARVTPLWSATAPDGPPPGPARLGQLRRRFHELGAVNPYAVDEYAALKARLETLETQASDLQTAIAKTRDLIVELDTMIADRFRTTFAALEAAFSTRFEQLFGGGFAKLSLTDPTDLGATGIEIVARPPGKKAQALAMLSGGERALTAVALLFAMLEVRPVPFCVLDEVDAALDEANIGRFADALRSLAHETQFIVITHNRGTIEAADALYGVTVGDDSVSRVISLRLDEAQAIAARDRDRTALAG
ncbi:MAG TPA: chromosome segregation protein SMC [Candidatus Limnocylindrales bacterium]|nr:chromosome segregation protein SMC [Candidatus Limnocylindrales bacterium]